MYSVGRDDDSGVNSPSLEELSESSIVDPPAIVKIVHHVPVCKFPGKS